MNQSNYTILLLALLLMLGVGIWQVAGALRERQAERHREAVSRAWWIDPERQMQDK